MILGLFGKGRAPVAECTTFGNKTFAALETPPLIPTHILEALSNVAKHCLHILPSLSTSNWTGKDIPFERNSSSIRELHSDTTCREAAVRSSLFPLIVVVSHPHPKQKVETSESRSEEMKLEEAICANYKNRYCENYRIHVYSDVITVTVYTSAWC